MRKNEMEKNMIKMEIFHLNLIMLMEKVLNIIKVLILILKVNIQMERKKKEKNILIIVKP